MRALTTLLWVQLLLGCVAAVLSWGPMFAGAMGTEWTSRLKTELETIQQSAEYREPPQIGGLSYSNIVDGLQRSTWDAMHLAGYCFFAGIALVIASTVELCLLYRLKQRITETQPTKADGAADRGR